MCPLSVVMTVAVSVNVSMELSVGPFLGHTSCLENCGRVHEITCLVSSNATVAAIW
jgi:hypothetical protein